MIHHWDDALRRGNAGLQRVVAHLEAEGRRVIDISAIPEAQRRDVDLLVDDQYVEVKTDSHPSNNLFLELTCDGKPGCVFKSRADVWLYHFTRDGLLFHIPLPLLQHFVCVHGERFPKREIISRRGRREWTAVGLLVPIESLKSAGVIKNEDVICTN